ncbi:MAG: hypothetical protein ABIT83_15670 [Massilia sp.]
MRALAAAVLLGLAVLAAGAARAAEISGFRFHIVTGDDSGVTRSIADEMYKRLNPIAASYRTELAQRRHLVYVAIGPAALREVVARKDESVIISVFTSRQVWQAVLEAAPPARAAAMTAIYAEPAPADQLRLIELLYRRPVRVAAIVSPDSGDLAAQLGPEVIREPMVRGDDINRALNRIAGANVLLASPDRTVYNAESLRNILLSTYRHKQGVVGFSADMVGAGALATTYSSIEDVSDQVAEVVGGLVATGSLPPPQYPRYFSTIINEGVARSLDIEVTDAARHFARHAKGRKP